MKIIAWSDNGSFCPGFDEQFQPTVSGRVAGSEGLLTVSRFEACLFVDEMKLLLFAKYVGMCNVTKCRRRVMLGLIILSVWVIGILVIANHIAT